MGMTPPMPMARMIFIFRSMAGFGAADCDGVDAPLKIPMLFRRRARTALPLRDIVVGFLLRTVVTVGTAVMVSVAIMVDCEKLISCLVVM